MKWFFFLSRIPQERLVRRLIGAIFDLAEKREWKEDVDEENENAQAADEQ